MTCVIIIRGPLGCGKTSVAIELCQRLNAYHIEIDKIIEDNNLGKDKEDSYISQKSFLKSNKIACDIAIPFLRKKVPVIIEGNFYWESQIIDLQKRIGFPNILFNLKSFLEVCIYRDSKKMNPHGRISAEMVYKKVSEFDFGISVNNNKGIEESVLFIMQKLDEFSKDI